jgi:hypothetical protein
MKTFLFKHPDKFLSTVLWLVAIHSIIMGLALITQPVILMEWSGFRSGYERFFPAQGGVFHLLMAVAYIMGAINSKKYHFLIVFSIIVKAVATIFLLVYCFTIEFKWIILISGIGDGIMGMMIFAALEYYLNFQTSCGNG